MELCISMYYIYIHTYMYSRILEIFNLYISVYIYVENDYIYNYTRTNYKIIIDFCGSLMWNRCIRMCIFVNQYLFGEELLL